MGGGKKTKLAALKRQLREAERTAGLGAGGITIAYALAAESDRGCALVAGEFLSDALLVLLKAKFEREKTPAGIQEALVERGEAPIYTFAMRAKACRAFGLINDETYAAIDTIREIRNPCAHRPGPIDLTDPELADNVRWLAEYVQRHPTEYQDGSREYGWPWWDDEELGGGGYSEQRLVFMNAATTAWTHVFSYGFYLKQGREYQPVSRIASPTPPHEPRSPQE